MAMNRRRQYLIDGPVQLVLLRRLGLYAAYCLITATLLVFFWRLLSGGETPAYRHLVSAVTDSTPLLLALVALLPFVAYDLMKLTNRFVGPVYRVQVTLMRLARGESIRPVQFRDGDFWSDMAPKLNVLAARLGQLEEGGVQPGENEEPTISVDFWQKVASR